METFCLFGPKTISLFDVWSFEHVLSGFSIACLCQGLLASWWHVLPPSFKPKIIVITTLNISFVWEIIEHYLETSHAGSNIAFWLQGVEHWSNRLLSDNAAILLGCFLFMRWPRYIWPIRFISALWLFAHIFLMPHSMYLQERFLSESLLCF